MKVLSSQFLISTLCMTVLLSGCGSSSSSTPDDGLQDDQAGAGIDSETDTGTETETDTGTDVVPDTGTDAAPDTGTDAVPDTGTDAVPDTGTDAAPDTGTDAAPDTGTDAAPDTGTDAAPDTGTDAVPDTGTDAVPDTGTDAEPETEIPPTSGLDILVPDVAAGSDLERLITGIKRQVSRTLLDLNQRISQGEDLTDQQETCLGAFDPAVGEQLLAIDCEQALATGDVSVYVGEAAFYNTDDCHASIFNGNTDNCQLQSAGMSVPDLFRVPEGERRPVLVYAGSNVSYAVTDTMLHIESTEDALAGVFKCDIDLASGSSSTPLVGTSCASIITSTADHLDEVIPE